MNDDPNAKPPRPDDISDAQPDELAPIEAERKALSYLLVDMGMEPDGEDEALGGGLEQFEQEKEGEAQRGDSRPGSWSGWAPPLQREAMAAALGVPEDQLPPRLTNHECELVMALAQQMSEGGVHLTLIARSWGISASAVHALYTRLSDKLANVGLGNILPTKASLTPDEEEYRRRLLAAEPQTAILDQLAEGLSLDPPSRQRVQRQLVAAGLWPHHLRSYMGSWRQKQIATLRISGRLGDAAIAKILGVSTTAVARHIIALKARADADSSRQDALTLRHRKSPDELDDFVRRVAALMVDATHRRRTVAEIATALAAERPTPSGESPDPLDRLRLLTAIGNAIRKNSKQEPGENPSAPLASNHPKVGNPTLGQESTLQKMVADLTVELGPAGTRQEITARLIRERERAQQRELSFDEIVQLYTSVGAAMKRLRRQNQESNT